MENIKNILEWNTAEDGGFPFELHEKGLNLKGLQKYFFYFSSIVSVCSMLWGMLISINILHVHLTNPGKLPSYFSTMAVICICVCMFCLISFHNLYKSKKMYRKDIIINDGNVDYKEVNDKGTTEWKIKIKKFSSVSLLHYKYKRVKSWYIALVHQDKDKIIPLFIPEDNKEVSEADKRELLAKYGTIFGLTTNYVELENKEES